MCKPLSPPALFSPANVQVEGKLLGTVASQVHLPGLSITQGSRQRDTNRGTIFFKFSKCCRFGGGGWGEGIQTISSIKKIN